MHRPYMALVVFGRTIFPSGLCFLFTGSNELMGHTRDDAAGEAYDKVARARCGMGYPRGPKIDAAREEGPTSDAVKFPRVFLEEDCYVFQLQWLDIGGTQFM